MPARFFLSIQLSNSREMQTGKYETAYRGAGLHLLGKIQLKSIKSKR